MRVRKLDADGDMAFGQGAANYYLNTPEGVGQCIVTRLRLIKGEWFLDVTQVTDWGKIVGRNVAGSYDAEIKRVILATPGVTSLVSYSSSRTADRKLTVIARVLTAYSTTQVVTISETLAIRTAG